MQGSQFFSRCRVNANGVLELIFRQTQPDAKQTMIERIEKKAREHGRFKSLGEYILHCSGKTLHNLSSVRTDVVQSDHTFLVLLVANNFGVAGIVFAMRQ